MANWIISLVITFSMFCNVFSHPITVLYDDDIESNTIHADELEPVTDFQIYHNDQPTDSTTIISDLSFSNENKIPEKIIFLKTFIYDGPLIVGKVQPVRLSEQISIFSRFIISDEDITGDKETIDSLIIDDIESEYSTTTHTSF